ncbi:c-type cytochrome [Phenylobacterium sp.]|uniref:c-type cytochrome n=1 Tax=Phenylobacterium sp. TaxID=1871053 RepID=UPI00286A6DD0|nr:c-type cytochrome [Phenylobacterium sp.]
MITIPTLLKSRLLAGGLIVAAVAAAAAPPALAQTPATPPAPVVAPGEFGICATCHEVTPGARPSLGPNLFGLGGRKAGSLADYDYSAAMKAAGVTWSAETLQAFTLDPNKVVPGNKMDYPGAEAAAAKAIVDYLLALKG